MGPIFQLCLAERVREIEAALDTGDPAEVAWARAEIAALPEAEAAALTRRDSRE